MTAPADRFSAALGNVRGVDDPEHRNRYGPHTDQVLSLLGAVSALDHAKLASLPMLDVAEEETAAQEALFVRDEIARYDNFVKDVLAAEQTGREFFSAAVRALRLAALAIIASPYIDAHAHAELTQVAREMLGDAHSALRRPEGPRQAARERDAVVFAVNPAFDARAALGDGPVTVVMDPLPSPGAPS